MSATNRGGERRPNDAYQTDQRVADAIVQKLLDDEWIGGDCLVLEPSAGDGAFVSALSRIAEPCELHATDVVPRIAKWKEQGATHCYRGRFEDLWLPMCDVICGNPPFLLAQDHVEHALAMLPEHGVLAFLLRIPFLEEPKRRRPFWDKFPPVAIYSVPERPSFTGGKTDMSMYGVIVWQKGRGSWPCRLFDRIRWKEPRNAESAKAPRDHKPRGRKLQAREGGADRPAGKPDRGRRKKRARKKQPAR